MRPTTARATARPSLRQLGGPRAVPAAAAAVAAALSMTVAAHAGPSGILLTGDDRLHAVDVAAPGTIVNSVSVTGIDPFEDLLGIDVRPGDPAGLYALSSFGQLYRINPATGAAAAVGAPLDPDQVRLEGEYYGLDFNPVVDRIRVVSEVGENFRLNPDTGAVAGNDGSLAYVAGDPNAGTPSTVTAAAYTNNDTDPATGTTLYDIDSDLGVLAVQNPPNAGGLQTVGSLGLADVPLFAGFDILGPDDAAYAVTTAEEAFFGLPALPSRLYGIDLATGAATDLGLLGDGSLPVTGFALTDGPVPIPLPPAVLAVPVALAIAGACHRRCRRRGGQV